MQQQTYKNKSIIALILVLCLATPFMFYTTSTVVLATHTHVCYDEEKDTCDEEKECCTICLNLYGLKYPFQNLFANTTNKSLSIHVSQKSEFDSGSCFLCVNFTTLVSLKVRLNN